jgi:pimeloyl-ACP methyl ester carboxylesterase
MVHGAIENSRIYYTESGKGLGPFLADHGFDVYAADLAGRGLSRPRISRRSRHGQYESITEEIPAFVELIRERRGHATKQIWIGHSWGGVLCLAALARFPELRRIVSGAVFFGTKRSVYGLNLEKALKLEFFWHRAARLLTRLHGYLPATRYGIGSDNESARSHAESRGWLRPGPWIDERDGFDYGKALSAAELPPLFFFAGSRDQALGHPRDVRALIRELGPQEVEFRLLGKATGNQCDYGHIDMLTGRGAAEDHFLDALEWVREQSRPRN